MRSLGLGLLFTLARRPRRAPMPVPAKVIKTHYGTLYIPSDIPSAAHPPRRTTEDYVRLTLPSVKQVTEQPSNDL
jgi:hypothetical protein